MQKLDLDERLVDAIVRSTNAGLQMSKVSPRAIGYSRFPGRAQEISVMIGMVGRRSGTVRLNFSRRGALFLSSRFLSSKQEEIGDDVLDAVGEITNIVAGRLKAELGEKEYGITNISCPSIVVGAQYHVYHFRGFRTATVEFELEEIPAHLVTDRLFSISVSLSQS